MFDNIEDIRSDMSVLHRIDEIEEMPSRRFFSFAERLAHYEGAMRHLAMRHLEDEEGSPAPTAAPAIGRDAAEMGDLDAMAVHPVWGQIGTFSRAPLAEPE